MTGGSKGRSGCHTGGGAPIHDKGRVSKNGVTSQRKRNALRYSVLHGDEIEGDDKSVTKPVKISRSPAFKSDSPFKVVQEDSRQAVKTMINLNEAPPCTPSKSRYGLKEQTVSERNLMTSPNSGSRCSNGSPFSFGTSTSSPSFKFAQREPVKLPATPRSVGLKLSASNASIALRGLPSLGPPSISSPQTPSAKQGNFVVADSIASRDSVVHRFWSPSPKKVWSYLITGGVSDFLHCAIANVEDVMELQKNGSVYFTGAAAPFIKSHGSENLKIKKFQRWNRFSWKVEVQELGSEASRQVILMLPHNKGQEDIDLREGMMISLGPIYQELSNIKVYLKWNIAHS